MTAVDSAIAAARSAHDPEAVVEGAMGALFPHLGDRTAHLVAGAPDPGQSQHFVCGAFLVTPARRHQMLVGNTGFPPDQRRLLIPIVGGHPGVVIATARPLLLPDTRVLREFRQYLRTSRMSSAAYAPLLGPDGAAFGLIIMAAQAAGTMRQAGLDALVAVAPHVAEGWRRTGGAGWLAAEYAAVRP
jgi:hypothetical protein